MINIHQCLYSQWLQGDKYKVSDACSCKTATANYSDDQLTAFVKSSYPEQVPKTFNVSLLPQEIEHFLYHWVQQGTLPKGFNK